MKMSTLSGIVFLTASTLLFACQSNKSSSTSSQSKETKQEVSSTTPATDSTQNSSPNKVVNNNRLMELLPEKEIKKQAAPHDKRSKQ